MPSDHPVRQHGVGHFDKPRHIRAAHIIQAFALGAVIDANLARKLRCRAIVPGANNPLDDPDEDAVVLKGLGILYCPSFVANVGGCIHLFGGRLGWSDLASLDTFGVSVFASLRI